MNCFDCDSDGQATSAVAICANCGAAVCAAHATTSPQMVQFQNGLGMRTQAGRARQIHCPTCTATRATV
jgi:hypothetical protein